jgi:hypothetical protein
MKTTRRLDRKVAQPQPGLEHARSHPGAVFLAVAVVCALVVCVVLRVPASRGATARVAGTLSLSDTGHLHRTSHHGFTLDEQGSASGTIAGTIYIHLKIVSTNRVTAEVSIYPSGSSITGYATADYRPAGAVASFSGTMVIERGTGRYNGAHGSGLSFTGTVARSDDAVTVRVSGRIST